jgi:ethanolamine kinase
MQKWILALPCGTEEQRVRQAQLQKELDRSFRQLDRTTGLGQYGLVFGHCDLLSANIIILPPSTSRPEPSREETVSFIDYEYATPCPAAFDIANHFAEWGGYDCDYNILPTRSLRKAYLKEYLASYSAHANQPLEDETAALQQLFEDVDNYRGMPGFYWGIWALIQATISQIDFPYATYAEERLDEYWDWRNETSGARKREGREMPLRERRWAEE